MKSFVKFGVGALLILGGVVGIVAVLTGQVEKTARHIVDNGETTTGRIEYRERHMFVGRYGKIAGGGVYYTMTYNFKTLDGKTYGGNINVSKEQAYAVNDGDEITVRYLKGQPSINSPLGFKEYMSENDIKNLPLGTMIITYLATILGGVWLCWSNWMRIRPQPKSRLAPAAVSRVAPRSAPRASLESATANSRRGTASFGRR